MDAAETARRAFGYPSLRPGQRTAMDAVLAGRDALVVMPTGAGKSAVYQVPALLLRGPTVVVSPLIALQRDQVARLAGTAAGGAVSASSAESADARTAAYERLRTGEVEFLFLAPEQLANDAVVDAVAAARPSLVAVDEAHCVSSWGHDFRPDYLRLAGVVERLGRPPVVALTATASPPVRDEIVRRLALRDPAIVVCGFDRPNIRLSVARFDTADAKREALLLRAAGEVKPGLVYTATRRAAETLAADLAELGLRAAAYHAGRRVSDRDDVQRRFMAGDLDVVVSTTAFGMGIDKADVRFVLHAEPADSPDAYYQEIGRSGRDGAPAEAVLFYRPEDLALRRFFAAGRVDARLVRRVAALVRGAGRPVAVAELRRELGLSARRTTTLLNLVEATGGVEPAGDGRVRLGPDAPDPDEVVRRALDAEQSRRQVERSRVAMMQAYAETRGCRRTFLLGYFGEATSGACDRCDNCEAGLVEASVADDGYTAGTRVRHGEWGAGQVVGRENGHLVVLFDDVGYKTLAVEVVTERGLLRPA